MKTPPHLWTPEVIDAFIASRKAGRCSPSYEAWLRYTLGQLAATNHTLPQQPEPIEAMLARLTVSPQTKRDITLALRMLYRFAAARFGSTNPMTTISIERPRDRQLHTLNPGEIHQLLDWANPPSRFPRDHALLFFLLDTGARIGEAHNLQWRDFDRDDNGLFTVRLNGKTGERIVPVSPEAVHAINAARDGATLWPGKRGPLTLSGLKHTVKIALRRAGIAGGPHLLRHTFGRNYIRNDGDEFSLQALMGHASLAMTRKYVTLDIRDLQRKHALFSPLAQRHRRAGKQLPLQEAL